MGQPRPGAASTAAPRPRAAAGTGRTWCPWLMQARHRLRQAAPGPAAAPAANSPAARLGSAGLGSARLGSAWSGSARLVPAPLAPGLPPRSNKGEADRLRPPDGPAQPPD